MASKMAILSRTHSLIRTTSLNNVCFFKPISTFTHLSQEPQLANEPVDISSTPLPPNPASGSPLYNENWRNPFTNYSMSHSMIPDGLLNQSPNYRIQALSQTLDVQSLLSVFADWMASQRWEDMKQLFEFWIRSLDKDGKPNKPDVNLYNNYLRANLMSNATAGVLLDLLARMEDYAISPNTASFNLVLKAMYQAREVEAAEKLLERLDFESFSSFNLQQTVVFFYMSTVFVPPASRLTSLWNSYIIACSLGIKSLTFNGAPRYCVCYFGT